MMTDQTMITAETGAIAHEGLLDDWMPRKELAGIIGISADTLKRWESGRAPGDGVGGRARSPSVAQRATGVTLAAIAGLRRRFGLRDLEPDGDDDECVSF